MTARLISTRGRVARLLLAAIVVALSSVFLLAPSSSALSSAQAIRAAAPYPPVFCPTISISTTHPFPGETITISGQGFDGVQSLTLVLTPGNVVLGHVATSTAGTFTTHVTLPAGVTGSKVIRADGSGSDCPVDSINIQVSSNPPPHNPTNLPFTGVDVLTALAIALALIGVGLLLTRGGRRSYSGAHSHHH